jgi:putrescine aminotransferase
MGGGKSSISCLVINDDTYSLAYGKLSETFLHTTTYNGFAEESLTALEAINILSSKEFNTKVKNLSIYLREKLSEIKNMNPNKIEEIKGTGILNGIIFKSFASEIAKIVEKLPLKLISDKSFFLKKITATAISCELYEKHNILTAISDSSNSNHLYVAPSLVIENKEIDYFFSCLNNVLKGGINLKSLEIIFNFLKSK